MSPPEYYLRRSFRTLLATSTIGWMLSAASVAAVPDTGAIAITPNGEITALEQRASDGSRRAQYSLSLRYANGDGVARDPKARIALLMASANSGYVPAQNSLGWAYREGLGRAKDLERAIRWFRLAALQGSALALENLGELYEAGEGLDRDDSVAFSFYTLCAARDVNADHLTRDVEAGTATAVLSCRLRLAKRLIQSAEGDKGATTLGFAAAWLEMGVAENTDVKDTSTIGTRARQRETEAKELLAALRPRLSARDLADQKQLMANWKPFMRDLVDGTPYPSILALTTID